MLIKTFMMKRIDVKMKKIVPDWCHGTFAHRATMLTTTPSDPKQLLLKIVFTHWDRRLKFCPKCPFDT